MDENAALGVLDTTGRGAARKMASWRHCCLGEARNSGVPALAKKVAGMVAELQWDADWEL